MRVLDRYKFFASSLLGVIIIFILINLIALGILKHSQSDNQEALLYDLINYDAFTNQKLSIQIDSSDVNSMLEDYIRFLKSKKPEFEYHPATEFQSAPTNLKNTSIIEFENDFNRRPTGYDISENQDCKSIYCFGGSTTFGAFAYDEHTWPSQLADILNKETCFIIKNYGVLGFVPTQETNQFIHLIKLGHRPSLAIFMDGYNIGPEYDGSDFSGIISQKFKFDGYQLRDLRYILGNLPIIKLIKKEPYFDEIDFAKADEYDIADIGSSSDYNHLIANRFIENAKIRKVVADAYGIPILQFLQPNSYINYNSNLLSPMVSKWLSGEESSLMKDNYTYIYKKTTSATENFIDLSYLFYEYKKPAIVDLIHYSPSFNQYLASAVLTYISIDSLKTHTMQEDSATGHFFDY